MRNFWIYPSILLLLASCSEKENKPSYNEKVSFKIESSILAFRSLALDENGAGGFSQGDKNTLFFSEEGGRLLCACQYTYGNRYMWSELGFSENKNLTLTASYPELPGKDMGELLSNAENYIWNSASGNALSDLLLSAPVQAVAGLTENIKLSFSHKLHKFKVELVAAEGEDISAEELASSDIVLRGVLPEIPVIFKSSELGASLGEPAEFSRKGSNVFFIIPPQQSGDISVSVLFAGKSFNQKVSEITVDGKPVAFLESGRVFALKIAVSKEKPFSVIGQSISGWGSQGVAEGRIEI